ncbi:HAD family hydrolase [Clostridium polynesiense]|uniref:HAD family hydrolase n=1 Tax=Clostridium polynesiense TaxID=1325933 RepID=UPI00058DFAA9|nr:HAD-IA family hydrolase [Clostridium polynesiense]
MNKKYKCVIFDIDGTILNTERMNIIPLMRLIKEEKGIDMTYEELLFSTSHPGRKTLELLNFEDIESSYSKWVSYINSFEEGAEMYPGMDKVIEELHKKGIICGIVSSKTISQYEIDFIPTGIDKFIKTKVLADDTLNHKPHPEPLLTILKNLSIKAEECIYIGDTLSDFHCSQAAHMAFGLALWGARNTKDINADFIFEKPEDILNLL